MKHLKLFEDYNFSNIKIEEEDGNKLLWLYEDVIIGEMDYFIDDDIAIIIGYARYGENFKKYKGTGFESVKLSIDYLLNNKANGVFSLKDGRNTYSDSIWGRFKHHFNVTDYIWDNKEGYLATPLY